MKFICLICIPNKLPRNYDTISPSVTKETLHIDPFGDKKAFAHKKL